MKMKSGGKEKKKNIYDKRNAFYRKGSGTCFFLNCVSNFKTMRVKEFRT